MKTKTFTCEGETADAAREVELGSLVFLYNPESDTLVGPFTIAGPSESDIEPGAWVDRVDEKSMSYNIRVNWEQLRELNDARERLPILKDQRVCRLPHLKTLDFLDALKQASSASLGPE